MSAGTTDLTSKATLTVLLIPALEIGPLFAGSRALGKSQASLLVGRPNVCDAGFVLKKSDFVPLLDPLAALVFDA